MKVEVIKTEEVGGQFRVHTICEYGEDNLGLGLCSKYKDIKTEKPKWHKNIIRLLSNKYNKEIKLDFKKYNNIK